MGRCPRGGLVQPQTGPPTARKLRTQVKNGVGRLPHEEAADAVVKKKSLRPW